MRLLRGALSRGYVQQSAASWSSWDAFADHHGLDPLAPTDAELVAFVEARARAGASWSTLNASLIAIRTAVEGSPRLRDASALTVAAQRHLSDLFYAGMFDPGFQAPILCVWQVVAMIEASEPRDAFLVAVTYLAGLRPAEWTPIDLEHIEIRRGRVTMLLPDTKTGSWQKVAVEALPGTPFDLAGLAQAWLNERGDAPGPLICEPNGSRLGDEHIKYALRSAAAAAGVTAFSPYSLRRSLAVHADLLGVPGPVIRQRLRHAPESQVYRRYIEPMLALFDRDGAKALYLDSKPGTGGRVPVNEVRAGAPRRLPKYAFAAGSVETMLFGIDLASLRVPKALAETARSSIEQGQAVFRRWATWAQEQGYDPTDPAPFGLARWVVMRAKEVDPVTVESNLTSLRVGWIDATGSEEIPGWDVAWTTAHTAANEARAGRSPRHKSRPALDIDRAAVCGSVETDLPDLGWATACLSWATGATCSVQVVEVAGDRAVIRADGIDMTVEPAEFGLLDPVLAAAVAGIGAAFAISGPHSEADVWLAGQTHSESLRTRLTAVLLTGSGTRPSDIARARVKGVSEVPGGLVVMLRVSKGSRPSGTGRDPLIWAPHRDGAEDPVAAWEAWRAWHPASTSGPLLPSDVTSRDSKGVTAGAVSKVMKNLIGSAGLEKGLTAYGFRYGRAQEMHDQGLSVESIAEALGHDDIATTYSYIQGFDPFADGLDADFVKGITS